MLALVFLAFFFPLRDKGYVSDKTGMYHPSGFIASKIISAHSLDKDKEAVIYDFVSPSTRNLVAVLAGPEKSRKFMVRGVYIFPRFPDFISLMNERRVFYSDVLYKDVIGIGGSPLTADETPRAIYRYTYEDFQKQGAAFFAARSDIMETAPEEDGIALMVFVPRNLAGKDLELTVIFDQKTIRRACAKARVSILPPDGDGRKKYTEGEYDLKNFKLTVPKEATAEGSFMAAVTILDFSVQEDLSASPAESGEDGSLQCAFNPTDVTIEES
jgi:hypothetical protein